MMMMMMKMMMMNVYDKLKDEVGLTCCSEDECELLLVLSVCWRAERKAGSSRALLMVWTRFWFFWRTAL